MTPDWETEDWQYEGMQVHRLEDEPYLCPGPNKNELG